MIGKFQAAGFVVYADDHIGHGKTGFDGGTMGDPHSIDYMTYIKDERSLHDIAITEYPDVPYFIFGHSWGSMLARGYAAHYGDDIAGLMLCGLVSQMKGCDIALNDPAFKAAFEAGPYQPAGEWFAKVFIDMTERFENAVSPADWIANDRRVVEDHAGDPFNTFDVTLQLVWDLVQLYGFIENERWAKMVPSKIPAYLISGDQDPCGNYGEGLYHVANLLANSGNKVSVNAYSGYRHEIHNELDLRDEVEQGLVDFVSGILAK
jgi:alpha-beta hydrolase superfamily lysophospholipase